FLSMHILSSSTLFPYTTLFRSVGISNRPLKIGGIVHPYISWRGSRRPPNPTNAKLFPLVPVPARRKYRMMKTVGDRVRIPHTVRSEEHTSELQSREKLVCRLLL